MAAWQLDTLCISGTCKQPDLPLKLCYNIHMQVEAKMPLDLVFVRHGESEANVIQQEDKAGRKHEHSDAINNRADWKQRLSRLGIEQAQQTKTWIDRNLGGVALFDYGYVSTFLRTRETAGYLGTPRGGWALEDRIVERNWGSYGILLKAERDRKYAETVKMLKQSKWFAKLDGGESLFDVRFRWRDVQESVLRNHSNHRIIFVGHGDFMTSARFDIERQSPEEFDAMLDDKSQSIINGAIMEYTRSNPQDKHDIRDKITWRRITYPTDEANSPFEGQWVTLGPRKSYTAEELLAQANMTKTLLTERDFTETKPNIDIPSALHKIAKFLFN